MASRNLARGPLGWQFKLLGWLFIGILALVLLAGAAVAGLAIHYEFTRTKAGEVQSMLDRYLPRAATADQIYGFLDERSIEHDSVGPPTADDHALEEPAVPAGGTVIHATIRNDGYSLSLTDVGITFILDEAGLLKDYVVHEVGR